MYKFVVRNCDVVIIIKSKKILEIDAVNIILYDVKIVSLHKLVSLNTTIERTNET